MIGMKIAGGIALLSGTGVCVAQTPIVPEGFGTWPVTAILGFVAVCAIAAMTYMVKKNFEQQLKALEASEKHDDVLRELAVKIGETTAASNETNKRLNQKPCLMYRD